MNDIVESIPPAPSGHAIPLSCSLITAVTVLAMGSLSLWGASVLPAGDKFPVHWNLEGEVDRYGSKWEVLYLMPAIALFVGLLGSLLPLVMPRAENLRRSKKPYLLTIGGLLFMFFVVHAALVLTAAGWQININKVVGVASGVLFMILGNVFGKIRSNFILGIRTPWTLSSELSWNKTHRLGGKCFVAIGIAAIVAAFVSPTSYLVAILLSIVPVALGLAVYSYRVWKNDPNRV